MEQQIKFYRDYFDIDEDFFPAVTGELIERKLVDWKKFYPHASFVNLLDTVEKVISRTQKLNIWVEGAYGTGKSYAALTVKKLLEASPEEAEAYFDMYPKQLSKDLFKKLQGHKKNILVVHRYGSSNINGDDDLITAVQESVTRALEEKGFESAGEGALKDAVIRWLSDEDNAILFESKIRKKYRVDFGHETAEGIIEKLKKYTGEQLIELMRAIQKVAKAEGITAMKLDIKGLIKWLRTVIKENELSELLFIWDEFTEFFGNNIGHLSGFQDLMEMSETDNICFMIVTHNILNTLNMYFTKKEDRDKIKGRFTAVCEIYLPENIGFDLMGSAMTKNSDLVVFGEWKEFVGDLSNHLTVARKTIANRANIPESSLDGILPIHPYTAMVLQHLAAAFQSNARSMFDFIKNDSGEKRRGFKWFIDHTGFESANPLLTVDGLWSYFYGDDEDSSRGNDLELKIRQVLDTYPLKRGILGDRARRLGQQPDEYETVLKAVLLMQAIYDKLAIDILAPTEEQLNSVYEGTPLAGTAANRAKAMVEWGVLYEKPIGAKKHIFAALMSAGEDVTEHEEKAREEANTYSMGVKGEFMGILSMPGSLMLRYEVRLADASLLRNVVGASRTAASVKDTVVLAIARDASESAQIRAIAASLIAEKDDGLVIADASGTQIGSERFERYVECMAHSKYWLGKDGKQSTAYANQAADVLKSWKGDIEGGTLRLYTYQNQNGETVNGTVAVKEALRRRCEDRWPLGFDGKTVNDTMWQANSLKQGAECGITRTTKGTFKAAGKNALENAIGKEAWTAPKYWVDLPSLDVSRMKQDIEKLIRGQFETAGRASISDIYQVIAEEPYGFAPCNLTAFYLGFLLSDYADETYQWSNDALSQPMTQEKLQGMIEAVLKARNNIGYKFKEQYIVATTKEERAFCDVTSRAFNVPREHCGSVPKCRDMIARQLRDMAFPLWTVKYALGGGYATTHEVLFKLVDLYVGIVNNSAGDGRNENDLAMEIGKLCLENTGAPADLQTLLTKENFRSGMKAYLDEYQEGVLPRLAKEIGDNTADYMNALSKRMSRDANWIWNRETVNAQIDRVITEYRIIVASNDINKPARNFKDMILEWQNKLGFVKLAYEFIKNDIGSLSDLMELLYKIKVNGTVREDDYEAMLRELLDHGPDFTRFYREGQLELFRRLFVNELRDLDDAQTEALFIKLNSNGMFTMRRNDYYKHMTEQIETYRKGLKKITLDNLWQERTNSASPREWSEMHTLPVLCLVPEAERDAAARAFDAVNRKNPEDSEIDAAMSYLTNAGFYGKMDDSAACDAAFMDVVVGKKYALMLPDAKKVQQELKKRLKCVVYEWMSSASLHRELEAMARAAYMKGGYARALERIDGMDADTLKRYLKNMVENNMTVGLEIIANH